MSIILRELQAIDLRFPTSRTLDGSDAMNPDPDYSAAYVILRTSVDGLEGHGFTFTIGRGNEICIAGIRALQPFVVGRDLEEITADMAGFWRSLAGDSQLRWVGPEKGVIHLALAAITNALWDLWGKQCGKPVWKLVADMSPEQIVSTMDFRHIRDALTPAEALDLLRSQVAGRTAREQQLLREGFPAYTTSAGWLGYPEEKIRRLCRTAIAEGWSAVKIKVGQDLAADLRRCRIVREEIGYDRPFMIDANQVWEVDEAIEAMRAFAAYDPYWIEEPLSPDDIIAHGRLSRAISPIRVATGEHAHNRIMFKQFLQARALDVAQPDACRLGGLNEALTVLLLAARFGVPICPHSGGVGLCEVSQHVSMIDFLAVGGRMEGRMTEYAGHLHEHFVDPIRIRNGRYLAPAVPGFSTQIKAESLADHAWPNGRIWRQQECA